MKKTDWPLESLPYCDLFIGGRQERLPDADYQSATQQANSLRYEFTPG